MQMTKHGIPVYVPKKKQRVRLKLNQDYNKHNRFATMLGYEAGMVVVKMVPVLHKDYKKLKRQKFRVIDIWNKEE